MDFKRWKFSKQVQPELENFLKLVEKNKRNVLNPENKLWEQILPKLPRSFYDLENLERNNVCNDEIITIDDDDDIDERNYELKILSQRTNATILPDTSIINLSLLSQTKHSEIDIFNLQNCLKECLDDNRLLEEEYIRTIETKLSKNLIIEVLSYLKENVCDNGLLKLGESLNAYVLSTDETIRQYCKIVLFDKLIKTETTTTFMPIVSMLIKKYANVIEEEISLPLLYQHEHIHVFEEVYKLLSQTEKDKLMRNFLFSCNELEEGHLILLQSVISQMEFSVKQRFISLMSVSADKFKENKIYMKLFIETIKTLNKDFLDLEPILYGIIEKNKTIFKISAEKALNNWFNNCNSD